VSRHPSSAELERIMTFYRQQLEHYKNDPKAAAEVIGWPTAKIASTTPTAASSTDPDLAAWTMVANALLNLDETITKE
jgi:hypothetical protein